MKKQNNKNEGVYTVNGKKAMLALFEDEDYKALKSGEAVDNNGFRSPKGNYRSRQPEYADITPETAAEIARSAASPLFTPAFPGITDTPSTVRHTVPAVRREPSEQLGRQVKEFLIKNVAAPIGSYLLNQYALPWAEDMFGEWFCRVTGYRKPIPVQVYAPVIDAEEVRQADKSSSARTSDESDKVIRFPA